MAAKPVVELGTLEPVVEHRAAEPVAANISYDHDAPKAFDVLLLIFVSFSLL